MITVVEEQSSDEEEEEEEDDDDDEDEEVEVLLLEDVLVLVGGVEVVDSHPVGSTTGYVVEQPMPLHCCSQGKAV